MPSARCTAFTVGTSALPKTGGFGRSISCCAPTEVDAQHGQPWAARSALASSPRSRTIEASSRSAAVWATGWCSSAAVRYAVSRNLMGRPSGASSFETPSSTNGRSQNLQRDSPPGPRAGVRDQGSTRSQNGISGHFARVVRWSEHGPQGDDLRANEEGDRNHPRVSEVPGDRRHQQPHANHSDDTKTAARLPSLLRPVQISAAVGSHAPTRMLMPTTSTADGP